MLEHKCEICGRLSRKKLKINNQVVCNKHYLQYKKYGYFRDNSPRTQRDKNEIIIDGNVAYIVLYDKFYNEIARAIIDTKNINKVKYLKWRLNHNGYVYNNSNSSIFLHRVILNTNCFVDHINGNRLDNREQNLRICTKSQNQMNVNYKGYTFIENKQKYYAHIKINQKMINLGLYVYEIEAQFARWYAERLLFKDFAYDKEKPILPREREIEIKKYVDKKVQRL